MDKTGKEKTKDDMAGKRSGDQIKTTPVNEKEQSQTKKVPQELLVRFKIKATRDNIHRVVDEMAKQYVADAKLPGFRKGKTPLDVIKSRYKKALIDEAINKLINDLTLENISKEKIKVVSAPIVEKIDYKEGGDLSADVVVERFPEIEIPDLDAMEVEIPRQEIKIKKYDEQKQIQAILEANKKRIMVTDRVLKENDIVEIKYQSKNLLNKRMSPQSEASIVLNEKEEFIIPGLHKDLLGKKVNDKIIIKRKYPRDYKKKNWAGKEIEHQVSIGKAFEQQTPTLSPELIKRMGHKDETGFKAKLKEEYTKYQANAREEKVFQFMVDKLNDSIDFAIPESLVQQEAMRMSSQNAQILGILEDDKKKDYMKSLKKRAENAVKFSFIIDAIEKKYGIKVSKDDLEGEMNKIAEMNKVTVSQVKRYYGNPDKKKELEDSILRGKVMSLIKEKIKVKEV